MCYLDVKNLPRFRSWTHPAMGGMLVVLFCFACFVSGAQLVYVCVIVCGGPQFVWRWHRETVALRIRYLLNQPSGAQTHSVRPEIG
jgi:hypothetical protein